MLLHLPRLAEHGEASRTNNGLALAEHGAEDDEAGAGAQDLPYLLRALVIDRPNQVWGANITYIPIGRGCLYLAAVIFWASRAVLAWRLSDTMDVAFCIDARDEALARWGRPEIFSTDQGSPFTSAACTGTLSAEGIRISMDGRGRWLDNVFIERLWRSLKYEDSPESSPGTLWNNAKKLGQRYRAAHIPTPTTAATEADDLRSVIKGDRSRPSF